MCHMGIHARLTDRRILTCVVLLKAPLTTMLARLPSLPPDRPLTTTRTHVRDLLQHHSGANTVVQSAVDSRLALDHHRALVAGANSGGQAQIPLRWGLVPHRVVEPRSLTPARSTVPPENVHAASLSARMALRSRCLTLCASRQGAQIRSLRVR
jgi:hypothetical protein